MLLTDNKARSDVIVVNAARTYNALVKFRDECVPLLDEISELNAAVDQKYKDMVYTMPSISWTDPQILKEIGYVQDKSRKLEGTGTGTEIQPYRLQGFKHLHSQSDLHVNNGRVYRVFKDWHIGTPEWAARPALVSRSMDKLRQDLEQDINIAKMATQDYAVTRGAVNTIALMEDGTFYKELKRLRESAQKSLNYLVEHNEEIKAEISELHARHVRAGKEWSKKKEEISQKLREDAEQKALAEQGRKTPEEEARAEASFWKTVTGIVVIIAAAVIVWKTGMTK